MSRDTSVGLQERGYVDGRDIVIEKADFGR